MTLPSISKPLTLWMTTALIANEGLSYFGYLHPKAEVILFALICLLTAVLSWRRIEHGILLVFAELFIGGKGYLYSLTLWPNHALNIRLSIRLAMFIILMLIWFLRYGRQRRYWPQFPPRLRPWYIALAAVLTVGVVIGLLGHHGAAAVFFDVNAFLFFALAIVLFSPAVDWSWLTPRLMAIFAAAAIVLGLKSLASLGLFVHLKISGLRLFYKWIRDTGVGEIAPIFGGTYRVFFQSQVYGLLSLSVLMPYLFPHQTKKPWWLFIPMTLGLAAVLVSLSRSFWLGGGVALTAAVIFAIHRLHWRAKEMLRVAAVAAAMFGLAYTLNSWALNFPYPFPPKGSRGPAIFRERITEFGGEAAVSSRRELLNALLPAIVREPLFGYGFGQTITYHSDDPRQLASPSKGTFTTYAFELGYLDMAVKIGLVGLAVFVVFLWGVLRLLWPHPDGLSFGFLIGAIALITIHATTPYLNHPLGIGFILLAMGVGAMIPSRQPSP